MTLSNVMFSMSLLNQNNLFLVPVEQAIGPIFWPFFKLPWETEAIRKMFASFLCFVL
jgi:hypothetical protein